MHIYYGLFLFLQGDLRYDAQNSIAFYSYSSKISCLQIHICTYICMYIAQQRNI